MDDELDGVTTSLSDAVPRTTRESPDVGDDHEVPLFEDGHRGTAALDRVATLTRAPPASGVCSRFPSKKHGFIFGVGL